MYTSIFVLIYVHTTGVLYITQSLICFNCFGFKESYLLTSLDTIKITDKNENKNEKKKENVGFFLKIPADARNPLILSFFSGLMLYIYVYLYMYIYI
jgi:hypothetical protein